MFQKYYSEFLEAHKPKLHFSAHSHHFWPNFAREGHMSAYENSMKHSDEKWNYIFGTLIPEVQHIIAGHIGFSIPENIAFAPNTHDLLSRVISALIDKKQKPLHILTSNSEFHSFKRQLMRLEESKLVKVIRLDPESDTFETDLQTTLAKNEFDLIFLSHVFFNSGLLLSDESIEFIIKNKGSAEFLLDAYHSYCATKVEISKFENDLFLLAGGYKYGQAGEGMCFMTIPKNCELRPLYTGWFASYADLEKEQNTTVGYSQDGMRFWGSTIDCTPFFRFRSVWHGFKKNNISGADLNTYVKELQKEFLTGHQLVDYMMTTDLAKTGYFITCKLETAEMASSIYNQLLEKSVMTDYRGKYLRFGFAPYHSIQNVKELKNAINLLKL